MLPLGPWGKAINGEISPYHCLDINIFISRKILHLLEKLPLISVHPIRADEPISVPFWRNMTFLVMYSLGHVSALLLVWCLQLAAQGLLGSAVNRTLSVLRSA